MSMVGTAARSSSITLPTDASSLWHGMIAAMRKQSSLLERPAPDNVAMSFDPPESITSAKVAGHTSCPTTPATNLRCDHHMECGAQLQTRPLLGVWHLILERTPGWRLAGAPAASGREGPGSADDAAPKHRSGTLRPTA